MKKFIALPSEPTTNLHQAGWLGFWLIHPRLARLWFGWLSLRRYLTDEIKDWPFEHLAWSRTKFSPNGAYKISYHEGVYGPYAIIGSVIYRHASSPLRGSTQR